ncbi:MAG: TadE/TadG family type IV pilus assembly protein [Pseudorhodobacter sp.]
MTGASVERDRGLPWWPYHAWRCEGGAATLEFVLVVPVLLLIFLSAFEAGLLMTRKIMLERGVDMTMRELRLGQYTNPNADLIKEEICDRAIILRNCATSIRIELSPVSMTTWAFPAQATGCVDREASIQPPTKFTPGAPHEIMLIRVCILQETLFPTTGVGLRLPKLNGNEYAITATSAFVNEP